MDKIIQQQNHFINFEPTNNFYLMEWIRKKIYKSNNLFDDETESDYKLSVLNNYYTNSGFKVIDQIYHGLLSYILYYNPDAFPILNIGSTFLVDILFKFDQMFFRNIIGKKFSFATLSILKK
jgi:hypothetical protein